MEELKRDLRNSYDQRTPFVYYRNPETNEILSLVQNDKGTYKNVNFSKPGFVFASFNGTQKDYLIPEDRSIKSCYAYTGDDKFVNGDIDNDDAGSANKFHMDLVQKTIEYLAQSSAEKIVISRKESISIDSFNIYKVFIKLLNYYPNAFVYAWFHPETGLWMGATPETLISIENNNFSTMALAGTKKYLGSRDVIWGSKERREQQIVTDYISEELKDFNLIVGKPYTLKAGSILHICSNIKGVLRDQDEITALINKIHPTPAVCGIPMKIAKEFIIENENYNREYYTGYLGMVNPYRGLNLFVNLRCMKVEDDHVDLYMGGGITMESKPINEWKETCVKSQTMKRVLS